MKKVILAGLGVLILVLTFGGWIGNVTSTFAATSEKKTVTIVDERGKHIKIRCPVERIVVLCPTAQEIICAFGEGDKIVGHCSLYNFPSYMRRKPVIASSPSRPNIELLLEQKPDLVIFDTHILKKSELVKKIEDAGIPVIVHRPHPENMPTIIRNIGLILDKKGKAEEIIKYIESYLNLIKERAGKLNSEEKPSVYIEASWAKYKTSTGTSPTGYKIAFAGGKNIAAEEPGSWVQLSPEWVVEKNPDIIVMALTAKGKMLEKMRQRRNEIMSRPELKEVKAVKEGKVYIITWDVLCRLRYPVGLLYLAKWFHPDLFQDINPTAVHEELITKFYGAEEWQKAVETFEAFAYPK